MLYSPDTSSTSTAPISIAPLLNKRVLTSFKPIPPIVTTKYQLPLTKRITNLAYACIKKIVTTFIKWI